MAEFVTDFPVQPLIDLYAANEHSKDSMTGAAVAELGQGLTAFGVSPADIVYHLGEAIKKVNKG